jgi:Protein of unknown function (DUF3455)
MSYHVDQRIKTTGRVRNLFASAFVLACAFSTVNQATAQKVMPPPTPAAITPPSGNTAFLVGNAFGTQGYTCLPTSTGGTSWTVNPARPEATLFADLFGQTLQIIAHFLSPDANPNQFAPNPLPPGGNATWQSSFDTSKVWATAVGHIDAGSDPASCRMRARFPASCCSRSETKKGRRAVD